MDTDTELFMVALTKQHLVHIQNLGHMLHSGSTIYQDVAPIHTASISTPGILMVSPVLQDMDLCLRTQVSLF